MDLSLPGPSRRAADALLKTAQLAEQSRRQLVTGLDRLIILEIKFLVFSKPAKRAAE
jgi:hypothetical protein